MEPELQDNMQINYLIDFGIAESAHTYF